MALFDTKCSDGIEIDEHNFNSSTLMLDDINMLNVTDGAARESLNLAILYGHYLYSLNEDFRELYLKLSGDKEFTLPSVPSPNFLCESFFNILYYGLVVYKYVESIGNEPREYPVYCPPGRNPEAQRFLTLKKEEGKEFKFQAGIPYYYHRVEKSRVAKNNITNLPIVFCPISSALPKTRKYLEEVHNLAKVIVNHLESLNTQEAKEFLSIFLDKSWNIILAK